MSAKFRFDSHYYIDKVKKPPVVPGEALQHKKCQHVKEDGTLCGAEFTTFCRPRKFCDACQPLEVINRRKKANKNQLIKRKKRRELESGTIDPEQ